MKKRKNIKTLKVCGCLEKYDGIWNTLQLFSLFDLFDRKFADLMFFLFHNEKCVRTQKLGCTLEV